MQDILNLVNALSGLPLHALLLVAIIVLYRRVQTLDKQLHDCLSQVSNIQTEKRLNDLK